MHLLNVLLHGLNTVIIYTIVLKIRKREGHTVALFTALLFGLHPLATESVNWISGRTDLLAGTFVLLSCLFIILYRESPRFFYIPLSIISLILGMLSKEVALGFLPGAILLFIAKRDERNPLKDLIVVSLFVLVAALGYYAIRYLVMSSDPRIKLTFQMILEGRSHVWYQFLAAIGFYIKKIFIPYPLNFAIIEVDPLYGLLIGIPVLLFSLFLLYKRTVLSALFITGVFLLLPSLPISLSQIAWTPFAERYVYLPMAFILPATVLYLERKLVNAPKVMKVVMVIAVLVIMGTSTFSRNIVWMKNESLIEDTIKKSPDFKEAQLLWGGILMDKQRYDEAIYYFKKASEHFTFGFDERPHLYMAEAYLLKGDTGGASRIIEKVLEKTKGKSVEALKLKLRILSTEANPQKLDNLKNTAFKLFEINKDPMILYQLGKVYLSCGRLREAKELFCKAYEGFPIDDPYKKFSEKLCRK